MQRPKHNQNFLASPAMLNSYPSTHWLNAWLPLYCLDLTISATGNIYQNAASFSGQVKFNSQIAFLIFTFIERGVSFKGCGKKNSLTHSPYLEKPPVCPGVRVLAFPHEKLFSLLGILKCLSGHGNTYSSEMGILLIIHPGQTRIRVICEKKPWFTDSFKNLTNS